MQKAAINILYADDDEDDVELLKSAVAENCPKIKLTVANDGVQLMKVLQSSPAPDLILLDLNMPCKNGRECIEEIRTIKDYNGIPILIFSTGSSPEEIRYCLENGANHYFTKPGEYAGLVEMVIKICNGQIA